MMLVATLASALKAAQLGATYTGNVPATETVLFTGVNLADVKSVSGWFDSNSMGTAGRFFPVTAYHYSNDGTTLTVQFQAYLGDYAKGVRIQLTQDGDNIKGRATHTGYVNQRFHNYEGTDMMASPWSLTVNGTGYRVRNLKLSDEDDASIRTKLYWNGASGDAWDGETANWLTESGEATAWVPGARAVFTNDTAQTVNVAASGVTASHFTMQGRMVTFKGGTVTMIGAAEVVMRTGRARFECPIAGSNGFRMANMLYNPDMTGVIPEAAQLLVANVYLDDITNLTATAFGDSVGAKSTPQQSYFVENDGSTLTAQMQWYGGRADGLENYTKCVFIELTQVGPDIYARATRAMYIDDVGVDCRGVDFRTAPKAKNSTLFYGNGTASYGVSALRLGSRVELAADNTYTGSSRAENLGVLALDGGTLGGGTYGDAIVNYRATLEIAHTHQTLNGGISDSAGATTAGKVVIKGTVNPAGGTLTFPHNLPDSETVIFQNANLSAWTGVTSSFKGSLSMNYDIKEEKSFFFRHAGSDTVRVQFQIKDDKTKEYVKCAIYEFAQHGNDITCKYVGGGYMTGFQYFGHSFDEAKTASYRCSGLTVTYTNATDTSVTLGAGNSYNDGTEIDGALVVLKAVNALPSAEGLVTTLKGGAKLCVDVHAADSTDGVLGRSTVNVTEGSYLRFGRFRSNGSRVTINATGGSEVSIAGGNGNNTQDFGYLSHLTLADGAFVTGDAFRAGYECSDYVSGITVTGGAAVRIDPPITLLRGSLSTADDWYAYPWAWRVADVTDDSQPDLYLNGSIENYKQNSGRLAGRPIEKTGAGTVRLGAANSYTGAVSIVEGTVLLGADGALNADVNLTLAGGTLDAGTSANAAGSLSVTDDSAITVSADSSLAFADSSALSWGEGKRLTITGPAAKTAIRFGTSANGLTAAQQKAIRWMIDGQTKGRAVLNSNGYLVPYVPGVIMLLR